MEDIQKEVQELLDRAMQQPGVADILALHEDQKEALEAHSRALQAVAPRWVVMSSTSSAKIVL